MLMLMLLYLCHWKIIIPIASDQLSQAAAAAFCFFVGVIFAKNLRFISSTPKNGTNLPKCQAAVVLFVVSPPLASGRLPFAQGKVPPAKKERKDGQLQCPANPKNETRLFAVKRLFQNSSNRKGSIPCQPFRPPCHIPHATPEILPSSLSPKDP